MLHKLFKGHKYVEYSDGYDGIEPTYSCAVCDSENIVKRSKVNMLDEINGKIFTLACEVHGLEKGDLKALPTYEMIKEFLIDNDWAVDDNKTSPDTASYGYELNEEKLAEALKEGLRPAPPSILVAKNKKQQKEWQKEYPYLKVLLEERMPE